MLIVVSLVFILLMPVLLLGWEYTQTFWLQNWYLAVVFVVILAVLNGYFFLNWRLFTLLEAEKWEALLIHLEDRILRRGGFSRHEVRVLVNTYLVRSDLEAVTRLEQHLLKARPRMVDGFALEFGIPYILNNDPVKMEAYFVRAAENKRAPDIEWLEWNLAFAFVLRQKVTEAAMRLRDLAVRAKDSVIRLLSLYLLGMLKTHDDEVPRVLDRETAHFRKKYSKEAWARQLERAKGNIEVVILTRLVKDATKWMYEADA